MSYDYPECGPFGITLSQQMGRLANLNAGMDSRQWANAKQDGCLACPGRKLPSWPPPDSQFLYPTLQKEKQTVLGASQYDPDLVNCPEAAPWQTEAVVKNSLPCAMTKANALLGAAAGPGYDAVEHGPDLVDDADISAEVARSILRGSIPMHYNGANGPNGSSGGNSIGGANGTGGPCGGNLIGYANAGERYFGDAPDKGGGASDAKEQPTYGMFPRIANAWTGIAYDMAHYDQLPADDGCASKMGYIFVRDDRWKYLLMSGLVLLFAILLIAAIVSTSMGSSSPPAAGSMPGGRHIFDLSNLGIANLEDMQIIIRPREP